MSLALRIIPKLDIKGSNLVKGVNLEGLRVLGKPQSFAKFYYENGADELIYQDVVASLYGRNTILDIISKTAKEIFIPLTVGGGIRTIQDISTILHAGADKVSINTAAIGNPELISSAANVFGSSTIVVSIEVIKQTNGTYKSFTDNGRNTTDKEVIAWSKEIQRLGAGEISLTSVDQEGSGKGFDLVLAKSVTDAVSIPVVVHGGAGKIQHVLNLAKAVPISGVAIASLFHYNYIKHNRNTDNYDEEGNIDFLKSTKILSNIQSVSIDDLKSYLLQNDIPCRKHETFI